MVEIGEDVPKRSGGWKDNLNEEWKGMGEIEEEEKEQRKRKMKEIFG